MVTPAAAPLVKQIITKQLGTACFTYVSSFDELGADSIDMVEILATLEIGFRIRITDDEAAECDTVGAAIALVDRKVAEQLLTYRQQAGTSPACSPNSEAPAGPAAGVSVPAALPDLDARGASIQPPETSDDYQRPSQ